MEWLLTPLRGWTWSLFDWNKASHHEIFLMDRKYQNSGLTVQVVLYLLLPKKQKKQRSEGSRNPARIIEWNSASIELPSNYFIQQTIYIIFISIQSMVSVSTVFKDWSPCGMNLKPCNVSHTVTQSIATDCWNHQYLIVILGH